MKSRIRNLFTSNELSSDVVKAKILEFGQDYLSGGWNQLKIDDVESKQITGGQSNLLYLASSSSSKLSANEPSRFLIRIHCQAEEEQICIDTVVFSVLAERGLGPKMYGFFDGGRIEEYLPSITFNEDDIQVPKNSQRIGSFYPNYHIIDVPISKKPGAIEMIRGWLNSYKELGGKRHEVKPMYTKYEKGEVPEFVSVEEIERELELFEKMAKIFDDRVVFSHNDLAPANILELDSTKELIFIDFEYCSYNWRGFDLGMHLSEWAYDYRMDRQPGYKVDQKVYETTSHVTNFCTAYIDKLYELKSVNPNQVLPKTENRQLEIDQLVQECLFFWPLTNLFWAVWSIKNVLTEHDNGIDLGGAASDRFAIYYHLKPRSQAIYEKLSRHH